jgi:hypothetical protein
MHWGDLTFYDICSPSHRFAPADKPALRQMPFIPGGFTLTMLDGHHRRPQESTSTHPWDIDRLIVAQFIVALEALDVGGTLLVTLGNVESPKTARFLYMLDKLSETITAFKHNGSHATRSTFYAVAKGVGLGVKGNERAMYLEHLKNVWWELTFGGDKGDGRWLGENDLDFIIDLESLRATYLDRLIELGKGPWRVQRNALDRMFKKIREGERRRSAEDRDV